MIDTANMETKEVLQAAKTYAKDTNIKDIVIATTTGETGVQAANVFDTDRFNLVAITHSTGFKNPGEQELQEKNKNKMEEQGVHVFTGPMVFHSWNDYYRKKHQTHTTTTIIADTLRMFGQGMKVAVEIAAMAADAGLTPAGPVLAIAGTGSGADTVVLIDAENSRRLLDMRIKDIVAKPSDW